MRGNERGATLLLAVGALAVVAALAAVMLADAQSTLRRSDRFGDRAGAEAVLDVAVSSAWGDILGGASAPFSDTGSTATGSWSVRARPIGTERWELDAEAEVGIERLAAAVTLAREPAQPYTVLARDITTGPLTGRVAGRVGILGDAVFGGRPLGDVQELIGPDATCRGCDAPLEVELRWARPAPPSGLPPAACPDVAGEISGALTGGFTYECTTPGPLRITGAVTVTGPVILSLGPGVDLELDTARVNVGGRADEFVVVAPHTTSVGVVDTELAGIVLAEAATVTSTDLRWRGSLTVDRLLPTVGSELDGRWDDALERLGYQGWRITTWTTTTT